ncbi:MAG: lipocalin family protein [Lutibacter sp.]
MSTNNKENFTNFFKAALFKTLDKEKQFMVEELEIINTQAEELANQYYQSNIAFKPTGAFYTISEKPLSGEYLMDGKKLQMEWETGDKNNFKIVKITAKELVLKDKHLKITHYYNHLTKMDVDAKWAKLKKEKELECTKPDSARVSAQKKEEEKINRKQ